MGRRVVGSGSRVAGSGWRVADGGWWVAGQAVKKKKRKRGNQKRKPIINITKSDILAIFYTIPHARDSLWNS